VHIRLALLLSLPALLALAPAAAARVDVKVAFDQAYDFSRIKTWGWGSDGRGQVKMARTQDDDPEFVQKLVEPIIVDAVATEANKKFKASESAPDVTFRYYLLLTVGQAAQTVGQFIPGTVNWGLPLFPPATQSLKILNAGTLVLDAAANGTVIWRGAARAEVKPDSTTAKRESILRAAVRDMLRQFPPRTK
jgi:hypothetical protein